MIYNKKHKTRPILAHAPGRLQYIPLWKDLMDLYNQFLIRQNVPKNLTIVTFNNGDDSGHGNKPLGLFESFVYCHVLGKGIKKWKNSLKLPLLKEFLKTVQTEFILICDSSDVFVVNNLELLIEKFKNVNCEACFNAEKINYPNEDDFLQFENNLHPGLYLNAGVWIAYTEFSKTIVNTCFKMKIKTEYRKMEQVYYKNAYRDLWPQIQIDKYCTMFQGLNRTGYEEVTLMKPFI